MPKETIDATIDGARIKVIFKERQWFAKPKDHDIDTPHFYQDTNGILEVHQDSADDLYYRTMKPNMICSGSYSSGSTWVTNQGTGLAVLPMETSANGFRVLTTPSGSTLLLPADSWCLMAVGPWSGWIKKPPRPS